MVTCQKTGPSGGTFKNGTQWEATRILERELSEGSDAALKELISFRKNGSSNKPGYPNSPPFPPPSLLSSVSQYDLFSIIFMPSTMRPYTSIMLLNLYEQGVRVSKRCAPYSPGMLTNNKHTK